MLEVGFYTTKKPIEHEEHLMLSWFLVVLITDCPGFRPHTGQLRKTLLRKNLAPRLKLPGDRTHAKNHRFAGSWFLYNQKTNFQHN